MMKKRGFQIFLLVLFILWKGILLAQDEKATFLVKVDAFGLAASLPGNEYMKVSPELELMPRVWNSVSLTLDLEYYRGINHVSNLKLFQQYGFSEFYYGRDYRKEASCRLGFRKYLGNGNRDIKAIGFFGEVQTGISWNKRDSIYDLLNQFGKYEQENIYPEARLRIGYQDKLSQRFLYAFSIEGDARRLFTNEKWYRCLVPECNLILKF